MRPERFELPTYCSGGNRSIHLSYGRAESVYIPALGLQSAQEYGGRRLARPAGRGGPASISALARSPLFSSGPGHRRHRRRDHPDLCRRRRAPPWDGPR